MAQRTNAEWVADLSSGGEAQAQAITDMRPALERAALFYVRRRLRGNEGVRDDEITALAEDSAQDAALLVLQKIDTFRGEARFLTWAASFAIGVAMSALRRRLWRDLSLDSLTDGWQEPPSTLAGEGWANPQLAAQRAAIWDMIRDVVQNDLTERQRTVLNLIVIHGVHTEEVEERLSMSASALYKMTHDARRKLKAGLIKRGITPAEALQVFESER